MAHRPSALVCGSLMGKRSSPTLAIVITCRQGPCMGSLSWRDCRLLKCGARRARTVDQEGVMQTDVSARNLVLHGYWYAVAQSSAVAPGPLAVTVAYDGDTRCWRCVPH